MIMTDLREIKELYINNGDDRLHDVCIVAPKSITLFT